MLPVKRLALTLGEPAGIGPDIAILLAQQPLECELVVFGCPELLKQRAQILDCPLDVKIVDFGSPASQSGHGRLSIYPIALAAKCTPGQLNQKNAPQVLETLKQAFSACQKGECAALVTGPVHKAHLNAIDPHFMGHTEYFAKLAKVDSVLMTFYGGATLVGLATVHIPLKSVAEHLTAARLETTIKLMHQGLQKHFGISNPHIGILGLNPHAGEEGKLGDEEITIIKPVIDKLMAQGFTLTGPLCADTAFVPDVCKNFDGLLAMYHDQGLAPIKCQGFGNIVNVTFGLPIIRTSVDHGTALSLAGTRNASEKSLQAAVKLALLLSSKQQG